MSEEEILINILDLKPSRSEAKPRDYGEIVVTDSFLQTEQGDWAAVIRLNLRVKTTTQNLVFIN